MNMVTCLFCHKNEVPIGRWNLRCKACKQEQREERAAESTGTRLHHRQPAAIIQPEGTDNTEVYVDKFGKEVHNPGYDLKHDEFGWGFTGKKSKRKTMIK